MIHLTLMSVKHACDTNQQKIAGTYYNQENADTQCQPPELINLEEGDIQEVQQFQQQQILQPECQEQEMAENLDMRLRQKTIRSWMNKNRLKKHNDMNLENQSLVAAVPPEEPQKRTGVLRAADLCIEIEVSLRNNLRRFGRSQQAVTREVHQTGQALTLERF